MIVYGAVSCESLRNFLQIVIATVIAELLRHVCGYPVNTHTHTHALVYCTSSTHNQNSVNCTVNHSEQYHELSNVPEAGEAAQHVALGLLNQQSVD